MKVVIDIPKEDYRKAIGGQFCIPVFFEAVKNGTPLDNLLQRLRKRISDLYNTDVTYDNGYYNTMDSPTLDKVLEYFDSEVQE